MAEMMSTPFSCNITESAFDVIKRAGASGGGIGFIIECREAFAQRL
jgi:hypothetical protein